MFQKIEMQVEKCDEVGPFLQTHLQGGVSKAMG